VARLSHVSADKLLSIYNDHALPLKFRNIESGSFLIWIFLYRLIMNTTIDLNTEKNAMLDFIQTRWEPVEHIKDIIDLVVERSKKESRHHFNGIDFSLAINALHDARAIAIETQKLDIDEKEHARYADAIIHQLNAFSHMGGLYDPAVRQGWDYDHQCKQVLKYVLKQYPEFSKALPNGWASTSQAFNENYSQNGHDWGKNRESYMGNKQDIGLSPHFSDRMAQPQVLTDWKSHGRSPIYSLVSAIYGYASSLCRHNTTLTMIAEVTAWDEQQDGFTFSAKGEFKNEVLSLMHSHTKPSTSPAEFEAMIAHSRAFKQLPKTEKEAIKAANMEDVMRLFDKDGIAQMDKENENERQHIHALARRALQLPLCVEKSPSADVDFT
jgi:hypothetical protein